MRRCRRGREHGSAGSPWPSTSRRPRRSTAPSTPRWTAGGTLLKPATLADWGGTSGYFADPDGHPWEVAHNPSFPIGEDGRLRIP